MLLYSLNRLRKYSHGYIYPSRNLKFLRSFWKSARYLNVYSLLLHLVLRRTKSLINFQLFAAQKELEKRLISLKKGWNAGHLFSEEEKAFIPSIADFDKYFSLVLMKQFEKGRVVNIYFRLSE